MTRPIPNSKEFYYYELAKLTGCRTSLFLVWKLLITKRTMATVTKIRPERWFSGSMGLAAKPRYDPHGERKNLYGT